MRKGFLTILSVIAALAQASAGTAQSTDPTVPQVQTQTTDWAVLKAKYEAEAAAYAAAQKASEAQLAAINAKMAADKAKIGSVTGQTTVTGATVVGEGSAKAEALLLVTQATQVAANRIEAAVGPTLASIGDRPVLILTDITQLDASDTLQFDVQLEGLRVLMDVAHGQYLAAQAAEAALDAPVGGDAGGVARMAALTAAGAILDVTSKLGSYFQTDYSFGAVEVTAPSNLTAAALVSSFRQKGAPVQFIIPRNFIAANAQPVIGALAPVQRGYAQAVADAAASKAHATALRAATDTPAKTVAGQYDAAEAAANKAIAAYEGLMTSLMATPAGGPSPLARVVRQRSIQKALNSSARPVVLLITSQEAAAYYTKKNLWTFLGGPPLYTMGGISVAYVLFDPAEGWVLQAGAVPIHGGYRSVGAVERLFPK